MDSHYGHMCASTGWWQDTCGCMRVLMTALSWLVYMQGKAVWVICMKHTRETWAWKYNSAVVLSRPQAHGWKEEQSSPQLRSGSQFEMHLCIRRKTAALCIYWTKVYIRLDFSHYSLASFLSNHAILKMKINHLVFMFWVVCLKYKAESKPLLKRIYSSQILNASPTILIIYWSIWVFFFFKEKKVRIV